MVKKYTIALFIAGTSLLCTSCDNTCQVKNATKAIELKTNTDTLSFGIGYKFGRQFARQMEKNALLKDSVNYDMVAKGFAEALYNDPTIKDGSLEQTTSNILRDIQRQNKVKSEKKSAENTKQYKTNGYQEINGNNGVKILMKVSNEGIGDSIKADDYVLTDCEIKSTNDGKVFDTTIGKDPAIMNPASCFPGLKLAFKQLKKGSKATFVIPSDYAFGENGMGAIPGNTDIEITLDVKDVWHSEKEALSYIRKSKATPEK